MRHSNVNHSLARNLRFTCLLLSLPFNGSPGDHPGKIVEVKISFKSILDINIYPFNALIFPRNKEVNFVPKLPYFRPPED